MHNVAVKALVTPLLIGGASLAGRRWGHQVSGWLVALPLTSGPVAFFLAIDHGTRFAASTAGGMLAATISQVVFALAYRAVARRGSLIALTAGCIAFALVTLVLSLLTWPPIATFGLVMAVIIAGYLASRRPGPARPTPTTPTRWAAPATSTAVVAVKPARWDIPVRMFVATAVVVAITTLAPTIGAHMAGLLSPFPVFGAVVAVFLHSSHGYRAASAALDGLILGLSAPAVFFLIVAIMLPTVGLLTFLIASAAALTIQAGTMFAMPGRRPG